MHEKVGDAAIQPQEKCHTSRNVVFDEASAWWSSEKVELPDSKGLEEVPEEIIEDEEEAQTPSENKEGSSVKPKSPWKTGVHHMTPEDPQLPQMELEEPIQKLRRTTRKIKPNPRYANAAFVDEPILVEPSSYEEASKGP